ncbi:PQQ-binding-like beta-propeller repeat protein [Halobium salinum]|uniref:PQQ-binding-like beta-propeller repeat protein n=1 Tax=Halobium salinum TaxID=1364940 RepID=A0ABD5PCZ4_9EURY|nr:PQQ-binding-like beta-propeller repeat protein [Halobium salinum]
MVAYTTRRGALRLGVLASVGGVVTGAAADRAAGQQGRRLEVRSTAAEETVHYEFVVDGGVRKVRDGSRSESEANDTILDNGNGTVTVRGTTGNERGDAFVVDGGVVAFRRTGGRSAFSILLDGENVSIPELTGVEGSTVRVLSTTSGEQVQYELGVDGVAWKVQDGSRNESEANDAIVEHGDGTVSIRGTTGNERGDTFAFTGTYTGFRRTGGDSAVTVEVDGRPVDAWRSQGGDAGNTHFNPGTDGPTTAPDRAWAAEFPEARSRSGAVAAPVVDEGVLYTATDDRAYAIDVGSGDVLRRFAYSKTGVRARRLAVDGDTLYLCEEDATWDDGSTGPLRALDATTGRERWRFDPGTPRWFDVRVGRSRLYAISLSRLYALDPADGSVVWSAGDATGSSGGLAVGRGAVFAGQAPTAYDRSDGSRLWSGPGTKLIHGVSGPLVLASEIGSGAVYGYDGAVGSWRWDPPYKHRANWTGGWALTGDTVLLTTDRKYPPEVNAVVAVDPESGTERWRDEYDEPSGDFDHPDRAVSGVSSDGRYAYVQQSPEQYENRLIAYDVATGDRVWTVPTETAVPADATPAPVPVGGTVYAVGRSRIAAFRN